MDDTLIKVLLIEDNPGDARLIREMLPEVGGVTFDLECADRLSAGLERLAAGGIDVVLLDLSLPDGRGLDTFVRTHSQAPEVPIVVLTSLDDEALAVKAVWEGAQDYLVKGHVDGYSLTRAIRYAIERKRAEETLRKARDELETRVQERTQELLRANEALQAEINERQQAEGELKELLKKIERAKQEWESTADSLPELVCLVDDRERIIRANRTVETWNLARVVDVTGRGFHELLHPGCTGVFCYLNSFWKAAWEKAMRGQAAQCEAYDEVLKRHVLVRVQPWKDWGKGTTLGSTVVVVQDITERVRAEEELRRYRDHLEELVEERTAELIRANEQLQREITERKRAQAALREAHDKLEIRVNERTAELRAANEEIKTFAYIVSHDLRAPLVNLKGFAAELRLALEAIHSAMGTALPHLDEKQQQAVTMALQEDVPEALDFIDSSVTCMDRFISALLKLSRLGRRELHPEPVDMEALVQAVLETLAHQIEERQVSVTIGPLPEVVADRTSMEQIMGNILTNAVLYLDPDRPGEIEITGEPSNHETTFHVRDNGHGISEEDMDKVFAPFRRAGKQDVPGEGMGLAYVQALVRRHGGRIWCESELEVGTTFTFTISNQLKIRRLS